MNTEKKKVVRQQKKPVKQRVVAQARNTTDTLPLVKGQTDQKIFPSFKPGDKVVVKAKIKEGDKERTQAFEGIVIARSGSGIRETFTVRKVSSGVGVERVFPINSPALESIELLVEGFVRRSKLYYLRDRAGRSARIQDKNLKLSEAEGAKAKSAT
jgi:large subunit ribosomal protein L19